MLDSAIADQMARLTLRLLEKKLEQEREDAEGDSEDPPLVPGAEAGQEAALWSALWRRKDLLRRLQEQHLLDALPAGHARSGLDRGARGSAPPPELPQVASYAATSPPLPAPEPPRILQHSVPPPPATIIQQLPQQPLITQLPPPQAAPAPRPGSIKEEMVEMMMMQNAQMHQILMHNLMLRALPPSVLAPWGRSQDPPSRPTMQDPQQARPVVLHAERPRQPAVHHHHHYAPPAPLQASPVPGYPVWPPMLSTTALPPAAHFLPAMRHVAGPPTAALGTAADSILPDQAPGP
ncbi:uncharacterized protein C21orf58 homolog [Talpa occidentalis]|uniref:uncharacterized protein C21orf58 homolog n=1 Tax=Talpa occidentalis TaxID=50954 RepID=UPI00188E616A|nr:uncharacterized protein C21orf58 homolog [Talpa occidentalis]